ncbi:hypothetical protein OY671_012037, partial [Metschnikowia pulcherrima]
VRYACAVLRMDAIYPPGGFRAGTIAAQLLNGGIPRDSTAYKIPVPNCVLGCPRGEAIALLSFANPLLGIEPRGDVAGKTDHADDLIAVAPGHLDRSEHPLAGVQGNTSLHNGGATASHDFGIGCVVIGRKVRGEMLVDPPADERRS